jgi:methionyl-tRNA synthetase
MAEPTTNVTLIVTPPPTPNGPLHLGHLSGPYVAADVAARAARAAGSQVLTVCGLDTNQNYVPTKGDLEGRPAAEVLSGYGQMVRDAFARARIEYDSFVDPGTDPDYRWAAASLLTDLVDAKAAVVADAQIASCDGCGRTMHHAYVAGSCPWCGAGAGGGACEGCGAFTSVANLVEPRCTRCGGPPTAVQVPLPVLRLEDYRDRLVDCWSQIDIPPRVRSLLRRYLAVGLPDVPLAYPTDWGIELREPSLAGQRLDVWAEMGLGYVYTFARALDPSARTIDAYVAAWRGIDGIWFFHGIDNAFYYAVLFPALFMAAELPGGKVRGIMVNEFYRLDGLKFSTSRNHAIWAEEFLADEDVGLVRLYLCWDRPDSYESDFSRSAFRAFRHRVQPLLVDGAGAGEPSELARLQLVRAEQALTLTHFDPSLAVRCLLDALASDPAGARRLLAPLTGDGPAAPASV